MQNVPNPLKPMSRGPRILLGALRRIRFGDLLQLGVILALTVMIGAMMTTVLGARVALSLTIDHQHAGYVRSPAVVQEAVNRISLGASSDRLALGRLETQYAFAFLSDSDELMDADDCFALLSGYIDYTFTEAYTLRYLGLDTVTLPSEEAAMELVERLNLVVEQAILDANDGYEEVLLNMEYFVEQVVCEKSEVQDPEAVYNLMYAELERTLSMGQQGSPDTVPEPDLPQEEAQDGKIYAFYSDSAFYYDAFYSLDVLRNPTIKTLYSDELQSMLQNITLSYQTKHTETATELIPFETIYQESDQHFVGHTEVIKEGQSGLKEIVYEVLSMAGQETSRTVIDSKTVSDPVSAVILVGTKPYPKPIPTGTYIWPLPGNTYITSYFGYRSDPFTGVTKYHSGMDIYAKRNTPILAMDGGTVIKAGWQGTYGLMVMIEHSNGVVTLYAHMNFIDVSVGDRVYQGQPIGGVGDTGRATGYHLHLEVRKNNVQVDPLKYAKPR